MTRLPGAAVPRSAAADPFVERSGTEWARGAQTQLQKMRGFPRAIRQRKESNGRVDRPASVATFRRWRQLLEIRPAVCQEWFRAQLLRQWTPARLRLLPENF